MILPLDDYNACMGTNETLTDGEILLHGSRGSDVSASEIQVCDRNYTVKKTISEAPKNGTVASNVATAYMIVTADSDELIHLYEQQRLSTETGPAGFPSTMALIRLLIKRHRMLFIPY